MKRIIMVWMAWILVLTMAACSAGSAVPVSSGTTSQVSLEAAAETGAASVEDASVEDASAQESGAAPAENGPDHADASDYEWNEADVVAIELNGDAITAAADGVTVDGSTATITAAGTYRLSGTLNDGQVQVDTQDEDVVRLILDGANLSSSTSAPLYIVQAEKVVLVLADGSQNTVSDAAAYVYANADEDEPNAAIFSKSDLTIAGSGALAIAGHSNDGISSKDGLIIAGGTISVQAADDGVRGKDYVVVEAGDLTIEAQGDGLKSDNEEEAILGYITVQSGTLNIAAGGDAINAQTDVLVQDGRFSLTSGGGSSLPVDESTSAKGIKGAVSVTIEGGVFQIDSADDALHSNGSLTIDNGTFTITAGDDGAHADATLEVNGGEITVAQSYEGLESAVITLNAGNIHLTASDDGINVAGGNDGSGGGMQPGAGQPGMPPAGQPGALPEGQPRTMPTGPRPGGGQPPSGGPRMDSFASTGDYFLYVNGGTVVVNAGGDGVDVNGTIEMAGGVILVNGPTNNGNGALDYDGSFTLTGGYFLAAGSSGMAMTPGSTTSGQNSVLINLTASQPAGTLVHLQNSAGEDILTFAPAKDYQSIAFSSPDLVTSETYTVWTGGSSNGSLIDGLYQDGTYTGGTQVESFTISSPVTQVGATGGGGWGRP